MNLVDGATTFPVPVRNNASLARSEDAVRHMEAVGWDDGQPESALKPEVA